MNFDKKQRAFLSDKEEVHCVNTSVPTSAGSIILIVPSARNLLEYAAILLSILYPRKMTTLKDTLKLADRVVASISITRHQPIVFSQTLYNQADNDGTLVNDIVETRTGANTCI